MQRGQSTQNSVAVLRKMASPIITMLNLMTEAKTECPENHRSPIGPQTHPVMEGARVVEKCCSSSREHDGPTVWICTYTNQMYCVQYALSACSLGELSVCSSFLPQVQASLLGAS